MCAPAAPACCDVAVRRVALNPCPCDVSARTVTLICSRAPKGAATLAAAPGFSEMTEAGRSYFSQLILSKMRWGTFLTPSAHHQMMVSTFSHHRVFI